MIGPVAADLGRVGPEGQGPAGKFCRLLPAGPDTEARRPRTTARRLGAGNSPESPLLPPLLLAPGRCSLEPRRCLAGTGMAGPMCVAGLLIVGEPPLGGAPFERTGRGRVGARAPEGSPASKRRSWTSWIALASLSAAAGVGSSGSAHRAGAVPDWKAVEQALGRAGQPQAGDVFRIDFLRTRPGRRAASVQHAFLGARRRAGAGPSLRAVLDQTNSRKERAPGGPGWTRAIPGVT